MIVYTPLSTQTGMNRTVYHIVIEYRLNKKIIPFMDLALMMVLVFTAVIFVPQTPVC